MIDETLRKLEAKIQAAPQAKDETKRELLALVAELRGELKTLAKDDDVEARRLAALAGAASSTPDADAQGALGELNASVESFEDSHPRLAGALRGICQALERAGI